MPMMGGANRNFIAPKTQERAFSLVHHWVNLEPYPHPQSYTMEEYGMARFIFFNAPGARWQDTFRPVFASQDQIITPEGRRLSREWAEEYGGEALRNTSQLWMDFSNPNDLLGTPRDLLYRQVGPMAPPLPAAPSPLDSLVSAGPNYNKKYSWRREDPIGDYEYVQAASLTSPPVAETESREGDRPVSYSTSGSALFRNRRFR